MRPPPAPVRPGSMRAWVFERYGPPTGLTLRDVPFPAYRDDHEVLVRVHASSVNPADLHTLRPPFFLRGGSGLLRPSAGRVGRDLAGTIEHVGSLVKDLHVGDEVFGVGRGAFAEYAIADETQVVARPGGMSVEQAAALPIAAVTALQGIRDKGGVSAGRRVLVNGASGGVGTYAVQIARALGASVSSVCSPANVEWNRAQGVERVFDYTKEDFARSGERYDLVVDTQLNHALSAYRRVLAPGGSLVVVGAGPGRAGRILTRLVKTVVGAKLVGPRVKFFVASVTREPLGTLVELFVAGKLLPAIDRRLPFAEVPEALKYLAAGHARGKVVITG